MRASARVLALLLVIGAGPLALAQPTDGEAPRDRAIPRQRADGDGPRQRRPQAGPRAQRDRQPQGWAQAWRGYQGRGEGGPGARGALGRQNGPLAMRMLRAQHLRHQLAMARWVHHRQAMRWMMQHRGAMSGHHGMRGYGAFKFRGGHGPSMGGGGRGRFTM